MSSLNIIFYQFLLIVLTLLYFKVSLTNIRVNHVFFSSKKITRSIHKKNVDSTSLKSLFCQIINDASPEEEDNVSKKPGTIMWVSQCL